MKTSIKKIKNVFNPEDIKAGDYVKLIDPMKGDPRGLMQVTSVGGRNNNKVFCEKYGIELYASCFKKFTKEPKTKLPRLDKIRRDLRERITESIRFLNDQIQEHQTELDNLNNYGREQLMELKFEYKHSWE